jgi:hypothetical protein
MWIFNEHDFWLYKESLFAGLQHQFLDMCEHFLYICECKFGFMWKFTFCIKRGEIVLYMLIGHVRCVSLGGASGVVGRAANGSE